MKYIGIVGSRKRNSEHDLKCCIDQFFKIYEEGDIVVSGGCKSGADNFAQIICDLYDIPIKVFPADWEKYGKSAGFIRNTEIAEIVDILIALVTKDRNRCRGTMDTVGKVEKMGKPVILDDDEWNDFV